MGFEKHAIVASHLALVERMSKNEELAAYKKLAQELYEELTRYEEQEAITSTLGKTVTFTVDGNVTIHATNIKIQGEISK